MNSKRLAVTLVLLSALVVSAEIAQAQVFDSGPSDPALFTTVINLPPDLGFENDEFISGSTQLNVSDGGVVAFRFDANEESEVNLSGGILRAGFSANSGSEVNISGGWVDDSFDANSGSVVNISGGSVGDRFDARSGSMVNISGGTFDRVFTADDGTLELIGGEFQLNGAAFAGTTITLTENDVLTGTLADGSSFVFNSQAGDSLSGVTLSAAALPVLNVTPVVIDSPVTEGPSGLRSGQTLTLVDGGSLRDNIAVVDATLNILGGTLGSGVEIAGSVANISGGTVGFRFDANSGSEVNISGGVVRNAFGANSGSVVNISGGSVGCCFDARSGSEVNINGGTLDFGFGAESGSEVNISGGSWDTFRASSGSVVNISGGSGGNTFTARSGSEVNISGGALRRFNAMSGSDVELFGGEFRLNGDAFTRQTITIAGDDIFTGTLADGSSFIFAAFLRDSLSGVRLSASPLPALDLTPVVTDNSVIEGPSGLRAGQTLTLVDGGSLGDNFAVVDATLNVQGGILGSGTEAAGGVVNISGGVVGEGFDAYSGSEVNISGGTVGGVGLPPFELALSASSGSVVNVSGGLVGGLAAGPDSVVNITGGTVDMGILFAASSAGLVAEAGSEVNISGGTVVGLSFIAREGSEVNITGTQFMLNGELLDALVVGESFTITEPIETLTGILTDGSPFSFGQSEVGPSFSPDATITVTLVSPVILGDVDLNGVVDFLDINPFIQVLATGGDQAEADCNQDGEVNFLDIQVFINILVNAEDLR